MDYWLYLNKNGLDIIDNNKGLYKVYINSDVFHLCLLYLIIAKFFVSNIKQKLYVIYAEQK